MSRRSAFNMPVCGIVHSKITFIPFLDVSLFNTFFQFTNSRIISRPIKLLRTPKTLVPVPPFENEGSLIAESQHFHHCHLLAIFSITIPILRILAQPLRRSVSTYLLQFFNVFFHGLLQPRKPRIPGARISGNDGFIRNRLPIRDFPGKLGRNTRVMGTIRLWCLQKP